LDVENFEAIEIGHSVYREKFILFDIKRSFSQKKEAT